MSDLSAEATHSRLIVSPFCSTESAQSGQHPIGYQQQAALGVDPAD